ncbi:hypothetical protein GCM10017083_06420 [Thalassobaculum fulvum]|uniref:Uncharacterized protein n=1 Tax=Thalassobaculum fulvum TaxID=1633335 RepID=A0A918XNF4_9PROT|nr:Tat pathway signal protein [Thalassobaculum fulvum]GHD41963.1 hypothetical protein GCM10017083_06420 [Thalassobaculum fulvum]
MAPRVFPESVRRMQASKSMRLRHELWHYVRAVWGNPRFPEQGRQLLRELGWALPGGREPMDANGSLQFDNRAGEDFLYMHRQMIAMTDRALAAAGEPPITRWPSIPEPGDSDFPVPPAWAYADPAASPQDNAATTRFLQFIKADAYYERTMRVRERFLTDPANLRRLSLGALGNLAEFTIHNAMHMRWAAEPKGYRPPLDLGDPASGDPIWDGLDHDYLGDTYSSHLNPHFWYLHGWIDDLVELWADVNGVRTIDWVGDWTGGPDLTAPTEPAAEPAVEMAALATAAAASVADRPVRPGPALAALLRSSAMPSTLVEITRLQEGPG